MKIAHIFAYFGDGGAEAHALTLAKSAKQSGYDPILIVSNFTAGGQKKLEENQIDFIYLPMESSYNPIKVIKSIIGLKQIVKDKKIDIIHAHMFREQMIVNYAKLFGSKVKLIRTFHRFDQFNWQIKLFLPIMKKFTNAFIAISNEMKNYMKKNGLSKKVYLIMNGVDKVEVSSHDTAIGYIGRLTHEKGIMSFIEENTTLFTKNKLVIAGDGPDYEAINEIVNRECLNVEFLGNISKKSKFFSKISVLVLPSETEVMPLVVLEAFSCGVPVVAFNLESLLKIIKPENGAIIEYPKYDEMAKVAIRMLKNAESYKQINTAEFESKYSSDIMWQNTFELYYFLSNQ